MTAGMNDLDCDRGRRTMQKHRTILSAHRAGVCVTSTVLAAALLTGCAQRADLSDADTQRMVELLMPQRIELVEAFTGFRTFDGGEVPDGIEVLIRALDSFGDPVKIAGTIRFELYTFEQASGERPGRRLGEPWEVTLVSQQDQKRYWNLVTGMYEVPLKFPAEFRNEAAAQTASAGAGRKFVLEATYTTPLGTHMTDECTITAPRRPGAGRRERAFGRLVGFTKTGTERSPRAQPPRRAR
jgi:hypothetical protein